MRRAVAILIMLLATQSAISREVSDQQLIELTQILQSYTTITSEMQTLQKDSTKRIDDLQNGFKEYKEIVDTQLIPRAKMLETEVFWLKLGLIGSIILIVTDTIIVLLK